MRPSNLVVVETVVVVVVVVGKAVAETAAVVDEEEERRTMYSSGSSPVALHHIRYCYFHTKTVALVVVAPNIRCCVAVDGAAVVFDVLDV